MLSYILLYSVGTSYVKRKTVQQVSRYRQHGKVFVRLLSIYLSFNLYNAYYTPSRNYNNNDNL